MKLILSLIFIAGVAAGQTQTELKNEWEAEHAKRSTGLVLNFDSYEFFGGSSQPGRVIRCIVGNDTVYSKDEGAFQLVVIATLLRQYTRYEAECWADSIPHIGHFGQGKCIGTSTGNDDFHCTLPWHVNKTVWTHREPTFPGFIQWMRRQK